MKLPRFVQVVLILDLLFVVAVAADGIRGEASVPDEAAAVSATPAPDELAALGRELAERSAILERREAEIRELIRGQAVLQRAGLIEAIESTPDAAAAGTARRSDTGSPRNAAFQSLGKAYAAMEPDSAAKALAALAARDRDAVVEMLIGWNSRTSGAILDAVTATDPELAADLSYTIWKRGTE